MKKSGVTLVVQAVLILIFTLSSAADEINYDTNPPFKLDLLKPMAPKAHAVEKEGPVYNPRHSYSIFINYELGMHCVGFDVSYCCIIPPYNSVQAQAVQTGINGGMPRLLSPADKVRLHYFIQDNSYSEGNKMKYWSALKDVNGDGTMSDPGDNMPNYVWNHLFIYKDLKGTLHQTPEQSKRLHIGREIPVNIDSGPSGKSISGGYLDYAEKRGGNIVFTDSLDPNVRNIPLTLTSSYLWDALGLPLTAFNDSSRKGSIRKITDHDFQSYQKAVVQLRDKNGVPLTEKGKPIEFFGTEPVDIANCYLCHSGEGKAARLSRSVGLSSFEKEYAYWKRNYPDVSEYISRLLSASIDILELHDRNFKTTFLKDYNSAAASNRLGNTGSVNCTDCHGDNISGNLLSPRPGSTGYPAVRARPLAEAIHSLHVKKVPMPDKAGRPQNCQACHPTHWQNREMNEPGNNPFQITDKEGNPRFSDSDLRTAGGGCYLRRDAHANPYAKPPFFLNYIGQWYLNNVSMKDEMRRPVKEMRGLYCTNCHNHLAHVLYRRDDLEDTVSQKGKTLRNMPITEVVRVVADGDAKKFDTYFADPTVNAEGGPLVSYYTDHEGTVLARAETMGKEKTDLLPWNATTGDPVRYSSASAGDDWWVSPGEPHCADCHLAPFVESGGGKYFPIDQPNKYSLYRYSKAHGSIACQSCHESIHGLYPVRYEGTDKTVDLTSHEQAIQFSPDGIYAGAVTCAACHTVNGKGIPVQLTGTGYYGDYWSSLVLIHFMREGDQKLPIADLMKKYTYEQARKVVLKDHNI